MVAKFLLLNLFSVRHCNRQTLASYSKWMDKVPNRIAVVPFAEREQLAQLEFKWDQVVFAYNVQVAEKNPWLEYMKRLSGFLDGISRAIGSYLALLASSLSQQCLCGNKGEFLTWLHERSLRCYAYIDKHEQTRYE